MSIRKIHKVLLSITILCLSGSAALAERASNDAPGQGKGRPKVEFDDEQSPLQGAVVGARDKKWLKKSGAGSDPRCARVIKAMAADTPDQKTIDKLCVDDLGQPLETNRDCLDKYCEDADCAEALVSGDETAIENVCGISVDDKKCAKAIFGGSRRAVECLQDPYDEQGDLKPKCRQLFADCDDLPALKRAKKEKARFFL